MKSEELKKVLDEFLADKDIEIITFKAMDNDVYEVELDSISGVTINQCVEVNRHVNELFLEEDFELTVASYSISQPFIVPLHYKKNIGREVEVAMSSGEKVRGTLTEYEDGRFSLEYMEKVVVEGKKRKEEQIVTNWVNICDTKSVKLKF